MKIIIVVSEYLEKKFLSDSSQMAQALGLVLLKNNNEVRMVAQVPLDFDLISENFAKRLTPVCVTNEEEEISFMRYDTRLPSGMELSYLEQKASCDNAASIKTDVTQRVIGLAVAKLVDTLDEDVDLILGFDEIGFYAMSSVKKVKKMWFLTDFEPLDFKMTIASQKFDSVVLFEDMAYRIPMGNEKISQIVSFITRPFFHLDTDKTSFDKSSEKASFQLECALPVNGDIPLLFFGESDKDYPDFFMQSLLGMNVQVVFAGEPVLKELKKNYTDRLVTISAEQSDNALKSSDFCVCLSDKTLALKAALNGTVPLILDNTDIFICNLTHDVTSGGVIKLKGKQPRNLLAGIEYAIGLFKKKKQFVGLQVRLPEYVCTPEKIARHCLELLDVKIRRQN